MSKYLFILLFCISGSFAQNINQFKYVEVPQRFDFQKESNLYNLNELSKMLLEKYGFVTYMSDEIKPAEAANNNCAKVLRIKIDEDSNAFVTKLTIHLLDCQNNILYSTMQGLGRAKDRRVAYNQALRMAFLSFDRLDYKYNEKASSKIMTEVNDNTPNTEIINKDDFAQTKQLANSSTAVKSTGNNLGKAKIFSNSDTSVIAQSEIVEFEFVAKTIENGFLLQSAALPEIRMQESSVDNYYIAQIGDLPGMIYRAGNVWKLDYYKNGKLHSKFISIKF